MDGLKGYPCTSMGARDTDSDTKEDITAIRDATLQAPKRQKKLEKGGREYQRGDREERQSRLISTTPLPPSSI